MAVVVVLLLVVDEVVELEDVLLNVGGLYLVYALKHIFVVAEMTPHGGEMQLSVFMRNR